MATQRTASITAVAAVAAVAVGVCLCAATRRMMRTTSLPVFFFLFAQLLSMLPVSQC